MSNSLQRLKNQKSKNYQTDKQSQLSKKGLIVGSIIATLIAITPYLFYLHESVPETKIWNTFLFTYVSGHYEDASIAMWVLTMKAIPLMLLVIWFFTCRHWWYHVLLVPIAMYVYQIVGAFNAEASYIDEFQLIYLIPVMAIIIPSIYLIRAQMFSKMNDAGKSMEELEEEFKIKPKTIFDKFSDYF